MSAVATVRPSKQNASSNVASSTSASAPPDSSSSSQAQNHTHQPSPRTSQPVNGTHAHTHSHQHNGTKGKKKNETPVDPATMYESLKNRIAALEEEEVLEEEEERRFAEEAQKSVKGMENSAIHAKYIELFAELKRLERDHAKEKQKLTKDKDAAKSQLTKANQTKTKMESLARELQKDNKRLREDGKRLAQCVEDAQDELLQMKSSLTKRTERAKAQDAKYASQPDIVVKVVCRYRAELFFKISRKIKLSRLFGAWTDRMKACDSTHDNASPKDKQAGDNPAHDAGLPIMQFIFTHAGRPIDAEQTPEDAGMEDGDEILAVEIMDLTLDGFDVKEEQRQLLEKNWTDAPQEARRTLEEIFDVVVRERLKDVLRQYELRERHFECVIRSKELELLLCRARAAEQRQLIENERLRLDEAEGLRNLRLRKELDDAQHAQTMLIDKLIQCCQEVVRKPNSERTQRLFASLRDELEKKRPRLLPVSKVAATNGTDAAPVD
ncbi:hypothetical protein FISHEDRAFT_37381 [Fistulina hepatica ATCC 64428]|uniref:Ubiquitin-like domain-containing protein n=1 Tax=Fistulina hepatica ATCC 64428 TaxID=1128425 RepID=A0A0D7AHU3_9AGAR|nr:hypothetical protein FISHEDRAFT_37381 [Fistulina hepatica ATCC 64428]